VKRIRMSIQKATGTSPWKYRAAIVALCACAVSLHAQSTLQDKPVPSQSDATQRLQERVTQLESEVTELRALVKQLQVTGFPAVFLQVSDSKFYLLSRGYTDYETLKKGIDQVLSGLTA